MASKRVDNNLLLVRMWQKFIYTGCSTPAFVPLANAFDTLKTLSRAAFSRTISEYRASRGDGLNG